MILKNTEKGAPILRASVRGNLWDFPVGKVLEFDDETGKELQGLYGFLLEVSPGELGAELVEKEGIYECSGCDYRNETKVAVIQHVKTHKSVGVEKAEPVGQSKKRMTLFEARAAAHRTGDQMDPTIPMSGKDSHGVEWYGDGFQESRPASRNIGGVPGRFGAA